MKCFGKYVKIQNLLSMLEIKLSYSKSGHCTFYSRNAQYWEIAYPKFLVAQNCIKEVSRNIYFFTWESYCDFKFY